MTKRDRRSWHSVWPTEGTLRHGTLVASALLVVACTHSASQAGAPIPAAAAGASRSGTSAPANATTTPAVSLGELDELFGTTASAPVEMSVVSTSGVAVYRRWVEARLHDVAFYKVFTPQIFSFIKSKTFVALLDKKPLQIGHSKKGPFYFRISPCTDRELERVHPWWAPSSEVWVCHDDYLPAVLASPDKGDRRSCDETRFVIDSRAGCGCGPNLMFCGTPELQEKITAATGEEIDLTIKYIVESGRPFSDLFAINETVRSGFADFFYARVHFFNTKKFIPPALDMPPSLRPREPLYQAGLLTSPTFLIGNSRRLLVFSIWQDILCAPLRGTGVETHMLLELNRTKPDFVKPQYVLAETEGCMTCHRKLEYGATFFAGWQNYEIGNHYDAALNAANPQTSRLYVRDHLDFRQEGPADPASLAKMLTTQPDYPRCMVNKVTSFVYEGAEVPFEVRKRLLERFETRPQMGALLEDAVIARAFGAGALDQELHDTAAIR